MTYYALVADDDQATRFIYQQILPPLGFTVLEADNGQSALDVLGQQPVHVLFLDLLLPQISGIDVLNTIHSSDQLQGLIVIVVSAHPNFKQYLGPSDQFLVKPVLPQTIREVANHVKVSLSANPPA